MNGSRIRMIAAIAMCVALGVTTARAEPEPTLDTKNPADGQKGIVLRIEAAKMEAHSFKDLRITATLTNLGKKPVWLVLPGDGSDCGWRTPIVGWSVLTDPKAKHPELPPLNTDRFCGNINSLKPNEVFTLEPKQGQQIEKWINLPSPGEPGAYRIVFYYTNQPGRKWNGIPLGQHDEKTMKKLKESSPCVLRSNELVVRVLGNKQKKLPRERMFDVNGTISRIDKATDADKKNRVLVTITVKGTHVPVQVTLDTEIQIAKGKLVEPGNVADLTVGDHVSAWFKDRPQKSERRAVPAERVMLFRAGDPRALPPVP